MKFEVYEKLMNGYEKSYITEDCNFSDFQMKKANGRNSIGFIKEGKTRFTWIPLGANVVEIVVKEATIGRRVWQWHK